jgi:hypothetical protein
VQGTAPFVCGVDSFVTTEPPAKQGNKRLRGQSSPSAHGKMMRCREQIEAAKQAFCDFSQMAARQIVFARLQIFVAPCVRGVLKATHGYQIQTRYKNQTQTKPRIHETDAA